VEGYSTIQYELVNMKSKVTIFHTLSICLLTDTYMSDYETPMGNTFILTTHADLDSTALLHTL